MHTFFKKSSLRAPDHKRRKGMSDRKGHNGIKDDEH